MKTFNFEGSTFTLDEMIQANTEDDEVIDWLNTCEIGESFVGFVSLTRLT